jgi:hypothetical protein
MKCRWERPITSPEPQTCPNRSSGTLRRGVNFSAGKERIWWRRGLERNSASSALAASLIFALLSRAASRSADSIDKRCRKSTAKQPPSTVLPYLISFLFFFSFLFLGSEVWGQTCPNLAGTWTSSRRRADWSRQVAPKNEKENQAGLSPWQIRSTHVHRSPRQEDGGWPTTTFPSRTRATVALLSFGRGGFPRVSAMEGASPSTEILRSWEDQCRLGMSCFNVMCCLRGGFVLFFFGGGGDRNLLVCKKSSLGQLHNHGTPLSCAGAGGHFVACPPHPSPKRTNSWSGVASVAIGGPEVRYGLTPRTTN